MWCPKSQDCITQGYIVIFINAVRIVYGKWFNVLLYVAQRMKVDTELIGSYLMHLGQMPKDPRNVPEMLLFVWNLCMRQQVPGIMLFKCWMMASSTFSRGEM